MTASTTTVRGDDDRIDHDEVRPGIEQDGHLVVKTFAPARTLPPEDGWQLPSGDCTRGGDCAGSVTTVRQDSARIDHDAEHEDTRHDGGTVDSPDETSPTTSVTAARDGGTSMPRCVARGGDDRGVPHSSMLDCLSHPVIQAEAEASQPAPRRSRRCAQRERRCTAFRRGTPGVHAVHSARHFALETQAARLAEQVRHLTDKVNSMHSPCATESVEKVYAADWNAPPGLGCRPSARPRAHIEM